MRVEGEDAHEGNAGQGQGQGQGQEHEPPRREHGLEEGRRDPRPNQGDSSERGQQEQSAPGFASELPGDPTTTFEPDTTASGEDED